MTTCPFCAEDIQDAAVVCKHCGRDLATVAVAAGKAVPAAERHPSRARTYVLAAIAVVAVVLLVEQTARSQQEPVAQQRSAAAPVPKPRTISIASVSDIDISAGAIQHFDWIVPADQPNCHLTGHIEVVDGGNKDVQVFVASADEYKNLANGHSAKTYLGTEKTTVVNLDVRLSTPGPMVLAIGNTFSAVTGKRVQMRDVKAICS